MWLRDTLRKATSDVLLDAALCRRAGLRPPTVAALWKQFLGGDRGIYWTRIWAIYVLLRWCDRHGVTA
jgi:asparagine synthase (glutamine-hydrolysing)